MGDDSDAGKRAMRQVLAFRPSAKVVERGLRRWLVVDGADELNATERGAGQTPGEAWEHALDWLLLLYREGLEEAPPQALRAM